MSEKFRSAFFAYPSQPADLAGPINSLTTLFAHSKIALTLWPEVDVFGIHIPDKIREDIRKSDVLICDVTLPNLNVYYEVGYAIGVGRAIAPTVNVSFANAEAELQADGLFDTIGFKTYENSQQLAEALKVLPSSNSVDLYAKQINVSQPLYLLDTFRKTDFRNSIVSSIKSTKQFYRSFDPVEIPRFSSVAAISEVTSSVGVVIPVLAAHVYDAARHNRRAAFLAGLGDGLGRPVLLIQQDHQTVNPIDFRDSVATIRSDSEIAERLEIFITSSMLGISSLRREVQKGKRSALQTLTLGSSSAENEFRLLEEYFVETAEFLRTLRGEASIVTGRKGSGKTAIFFMVRNILRKDRRAIVADLKPESHQLSLFRQELLKIVDAGVFDHTIASFWYFLVCTEMLLAIKREADFQSRKNAAALEAAIEIEKTFEKFGIVESGDFTSRINRLSSYVLQEVERSTKLGQPLSPERLTNIVFRDAIVPIKTLIVKHSSSSSKLVFLFDNIDKGWPSNGVHPIDVRSVRLLIEAMDKVKRDLQVADREFLPVVFLRNDIYELMVEDTPDRGKAAQVRIDWADRSKLRQVIYQRLAASAEEKGATFEQIWTKYFVPKVENRHSFDYVVDHCLMRPRFLINIIENAIANGINRRHSIVDEDDFIDAVRQHSYYLVSDFGFEIRDASGITAQLLYSLRGVTSLVTEDEVLEYFRKWGIPAGELASAFQLLLWYGVLGIAVETGRERYIYDYDYDKTLLDADIKSADETVLFVVNPALHVGLSPRKTKMAAFKGDH